MTCRHHWLGPLCLPMAHTTACGMRGRPESGWGLARCMEPLGWLCMMQLHRRSSVAAGGGSIDAPCTCWPPREALLLLLQRLTISEVAERDAPLQHRRDGEQRPCVQRRVLHLSRRQRPLRCGGRGRDPAGAALSDRLADDPHKPPPTPGAAGR